MFKDREEAGEKLADKLKYFKGKNLIVLAVLRGGVVIGNVLAKELNCQLGVMTVKKLGAPGNPELAIGAVGPDGIRIIDWGLARQTGAGMDYVENQVVELMAQIKEREKKFGKTQQLEIKNKVVILTDDGIATGATTEVAVAWIRRQKPAKLILAVPVAPFETAGKLRDLVDELIILETPVFFASVGQFYEDFPQVEDKEVVAYLHCDR